MKNVSYNNNCEIVFDCGGYSDEEFFFFNICLFKLKKYNRKE